MHYIKKKGFIAIETVITAALILLVGIVAILGLSASGTGHMGDAMQKLIDLGILPGESSTDNNYVYAEYTGCYPSIYNVSESDINPVDDFDWL